jgi:hypothetical protein
MGETRSPLTRKLSGVELSGAEARNNSNVALVALLTVLPFGMAAAWMLLIAKSSQRTGMSPAQPPAIAGCIVDAGFAFLQ